MRETTPFRLRSVFQMSDRAIQKAGANSNQVQAETVNQYFGINENRVSEIIEERCSQALANCVLESRLVAEQRISEFKTEVLGLFARRPDLLNALTEPSCVDSFGRAACVATRSTDNKDKELLSELLGRRFEEPHNRHVAAGINKAIEIVDLITDEELNGLTVLFAVNQYGPTSGIVDEGLAALDCLYGKLPIRELPNGGAWIDNLDIHDALRVSPFGSLKKLAEYYSKAIDGYVVWGLEKDSEQLDKAVRSLFEAHIPIDVLLNHELHDGYVRLRVPNRGAIDNIVITEQGGGSPNSVPLNPEQISVLDKLFGQMSVTEHEQEMKAALERKFEGYPNILTVQDWWNSIPSAPRLTIVGKALANANARRIDSTLPDLEI